MTGLLVLFQFVRADFLERSRRYSFLITVLATLIAAYLSVPPPDSRIVTVALGDIRGLYNSAWIGAALAIMCSCFLSLIGFYLVKNTLERDARTRVGQILWASPTSSFIYLLAKAVSNFVLLTCLVAVTMGTGVVMQLVRGEDFTIHIVTLAAPFVIMTLPYMAIIAAIAVLFESLPVLRSTWGNVIYFFLWTAILILSIDPAAKAVHGVVPAKNDPAGMSVLLHDMTQKVLLEYPDYNGEIQIGAAIEDTSSGLRTFHWDGVAWTAPVIFARLWWLAVAIGIILLASLGFSRFRERGTGGSPGRSEVNRVRGPDGAVIGRRRLIPGLNWHPASPTLGILMGELRLMLSSANRWWYLVAAGLLIAQLIAPLDIARRYILGVAWIWPLAQWSVMGCRERLNGTEQLVFSSPDMLKRQLPALWMAGVLITLAVGAGVGLRLLLIGDFTGLLAWGGGALFIPSLALFFGVLTGGRKMFELVYTLLWYIGPLNGVPQLDYTGAMASAAPLAPPVFAILALCCFTGAMLWRVRQARN